MNFLIVLSSSIIFVNKTLAGLIALHTYLTGSGDHSVGDIEKLSSASVDEIVSYLEISEEAAVGIINAAIDYLTAKLDELDDEE